MKTLYCHYQVLLTRTTTMILELKTPDISSTVVNNPNEFHLKTPKMSSTRWTNIGHEFQLVQNLSNCLEIVSESSLLGTLV